MFQREIGNIGHFDPVTTMPQSPHMMQAVSLRGVTMGSSAESDFVVPPTQQHDGGHVSPWSLPELFKGSEPFPHNDGRVADNSLQNKSSSSPNERTTHSALPELSIAQQKLLPEIPSVRTDQNSDQQHTARDASPARGDGLLNGSIGDKLSGIISKIGEFLQSVLPPEYAQYVQQYLPMAEQFINNLIKNVKTGDGANGSKHLEAELNQGQSIPDVLPDTSLEVDPKLGFDMKWGENGPELSNIEGLRLQGQTNGNVRSGRIDINDGNPTLYAAVTGADGQTNEVPIPLPDITNLLSQIGKNNE